jgi:hypothetical protein
MIFQFQFQLGQSYKTFYCHKRHFLQRCNKLAPCQLVNVSFRQAAKESSVMGEFFSLGERMGGRHDTQHNDIKHNDIQHNDTQHKGLICDIQHNDTQQKGLIRDIQHKRHSA